MGQKVHPTGIRLGIATDWSSKWYASKTEFSKFLLEDIKIRDYLKKKLPSNISPAYDGLSFNF